MYITPPTENKHGGLVSFLKGSTVLCHQVMVFPLGVEPGDVLAFRLLTNRWGLGGVVFGSSFWGLFEDVFCEAWNGECHQCTWTDYTISCSFGSHHGFAKWTDAWCEDEVLRFFFFDLTWGRASISQGWAECGILDSRPSSPFRSIPWHSVLCTPYAVVVVWEERMLHLMIF